MAWSWTTGPDGLVSVDKGDGEGALVIDLGGSDAAVERTALWASLAEKYAEHEQIPLGWILGVIYSESGGDPTIASSDSVGAGLMQLTVTPPLFGISRAQALDPETNVRVGSGLLGKYARLGNDLPAVASMFNAGPGAGNKPKGAVSDPWGYVETRPSLPYTGYIEKVVRASNYFAQRFPPGSVAPLGGGVSSASMSTGGKFLAFLVGAGLAWWGACYAFGKP